MWVTPAWQRSLPGSAVATTGSPKMSPHSANPRFEVRIIDHFSQRAFTSWKNRLPPPPTA